MSRYPRRRSGASDRGAGCRIASTFARDTRLTPTGAPSSQAPGQGRRRDGDMSRATIALQLVLGLAPMTASGAAWAADGDPAARQAAWPP
jgi:hypothetical protein